MLIDSKLEDLRYDLAKTDYPTVELLDKHIEIGTVNGIYRVALHQPEWVTFEEMRLDVGNN